MKSRELVTYQPQVHVPMEESVDLAPEPKHLVIAQLDIIVLLRLRKRGSLTTDVKQGSSVGLEQVRVPKLVIVALRHIIVHQEVVHMNTLKVKTSTTTLDGQ